MPVLESINIYARLTVQFYIFVSKNCKGPAAENVQSHSEYGVKWVTEEFVGLKTVLSFLKQRGIIYFKVNIKAS